MKKFFIYSAGLGVSAFALCGLIQVTQVFDWPSVKRWFYTLALMALCFYAVRAMRAVARFFEAKIKQEERK